MPTAFLDTHSAAHAPTSKMKSCDRVVTIDKSKGVVR